MTKIKRSKQKNKYFNSILPLILLILGLIAVVWGVKNSQELRGRAAYLNPPEPIGNNPKLISQTPLTPYFATTVRIINSQYLALGGSNYFRIADVSDPKDVRIISTTVLPNGYSINKITTAGDFAYVAGNYNVASISYSFLYSIDITNLNRPVLADRILKLSIANNAHSGIAISGRYAYLVSTTYHKLVVIDIYDPKQLSVVGESDILTTVNLNDIAVSGNLAFIVGGGLAVIDVSDPASPIQIGSLELSHSEQYSVIEDNGYLYIGGTKILSEFSRVGEVKVVKAIDPRNPSVVDQYQSNSCPNQCSIYDLAFDNAKNLLFAAHGNFWTSNMEILSVQKSLASGPKINYYGQYNVPSVVETIDIDGSRQYFPNFDTRNSKMNLFITTY